MRRPIPRRCRRRAAGQRLSVSKEALGQWQDVTGPIGQGWQRQFHRAAPLILHFRERSAEAALDLWRAGARVTLVHFGPTFDKKIKQLGLSRTGRGSAPEPDAGIRHRDHDDTAPQLAPRVGVHRDPATGAGVLYNILARLRKRHSESHRRPRIETDLRGDF